MQVSAVNSVNSVNFKGRDTKDFDNEVINHLENDECELLGPDEDSFCKMEDLVQTTALAVRKEAEAEAQQDVSPLTVLGATGGAAAIFGLVKGKVLPPCEKIFAEAGKPVGKKVLKLLHKTPLLNDKAYENALNAGKKVYNGLMNTKADDKFIGKFNEKVNLIFDGNDKVKSFLKAAREQLKINNKKNVVEAAVAGSIAYVGSDIVSDKAEDKIDEHKIQAKVRNAARRVYDAAQQAGIVY